MGFDPNLSMETTEEPVLVATHIVGGDDNVALLINAEQGTARIAGARQTAPLVTSLGELAAADDALVGHRVKLNDVTLHPLAAHGGFYLQAPDSTVLVLPPADAKGMKTGSTVSVEGIVLKAPRDLELAGDLPDDTNEDIYVLATSIDAR
jgi:hypothetical protein